MIFTDRKHGLTTYYVTICTASHCNRVWLQWWMQSIAVHSHCIPLQSSVIAVVDAVNRSAFPLHPTAIECDCSGGCSGNDWRMTGAAVIRTAIECDCSGNWTGAPVIRTAIECDCSGIEWELPSFALQSSVIAVELSGIEGRKKGRKKSQITIYIIYIL